MVLLLSVVFAGEGGVSGVGVGVGGRGGGVGGIYVMLTENDFCVYEPY